MVHSHPLLPSLPLSISIWAMFTSYIVWVPGDLRSLQNTLDTIAADKGEVVSVTWSPNDGYVVVAKYERPDHAKRP